MSKPKHPIKFIRVTMPDGSKWDVPALVVANNRAVHYATKRQKDGAEFYDVVLKDEREAVLRDADELMDWARNNMNWEDVKAQATRVQESTDVDFQEGWVNGEMEVIL